MLLLRISDHDPSGIDMTEDIRNRLAKYGGEEIEVTRVALTYDQVQKFRLRPNPVKRADSRAPNYINLYGQECWELNEVVLLF